MSKPDKAQITYYVGEGDGAVAQVIRFHSVIAEEHDVTTEVTKFPVQSGFQISNHAIKKNRKISITGVVTNHIIVGAEEGHEYGGNNSRVMYDTLKNIVRGAFPCEVVTNYGNYNPVIFTRFKTRLQAGKTDVMEFTMTGEEVQLGTTINSTTPTLLTFKVLTAAERAARVDELAAVGIQVADDAVVSEASVDFNESFQVETTGTNGQSQVMTYERDSYDPTTKKYSHTVHTSDTDIATAEPTTYINWFAMMQEEAAYKAGKSLETGSLSSVGANALPEAGASFLPDVDLAAGASTTAACLTDGLIGLGTDITEGYINTALGELRQTIYGAAYGIFGVNGDQGFGQVLLALGVDCLVAGAIGSVDPTLNADDFQDNSIPTTDQALEGAASIGDSVVTDTIGVAAPTTLTKISSPSGGTSFFGDLL